MKTTLCVLAVSLAQSLWTARASAQPYEISWFTLDGGGQTSSAGSLAVSGTIGQPDTGFSGGGNFTLEGGFWASASVGLPELKIQRTGHGIVISWPVKLAGFTLQRTPALSTSGSWFNVATPAVIVGDHFTLTESIAAGNHFYRLSK